jgi:hypothetical protein
MLNTPLNSEISNTNIIAICNGTPMGTGSGYFKAASCTNNLTIINNVNNVVLY